MTTAQAKATRRKLQHDPRYKYKRRDPEASRRREADKRAKELAMQQRSKKKGN